jgi:2-polyprenyl-3-methyl-5-hydroxy-6-metoxy-1,4-benzoquinol methylase
MACPVCDFQTDELLIKKVGENFQYDVCRCLDCKVAFLKQWGESFDQDMYNYYEDRLGKPKAEIFDALTDRRYAELLSQFEKKVRGKTLLDVGCGQGQFVNTAQNLGWNARGIDLSDSAIQVGKQFGLPIEVIDFFDDRLNEKRFDVISMFEFIEHVSKPGRFIKRAESLLNPGGLLYLTTPNFNSLDRKIAGRWWSVFNREHINYFSPKTLKNNILKTSSLEVEEIRTKNLDPHLFKTRVTAWLRRDPFEPNRNAVHASTQILRHGIEQNFLGRTAKAVMNGALNRLGWGSTITVISRMKNS